MPHRERIDPYRIRIERDGAQSIARLGPPIGPSGTLAHQGFHVIP